MVFGFRNAAGRAAAAIERRRAPRVELKHGVAKIDSKTFPVKNLSTQGFVLEPYQGDLVTHQRVYLTLVLAVNGQERDFATDAVVVRAADQTLAGRFSDLAMTRGALSSGISWRAPPASPADQAAS